MTDSDRSDCSCGCSERRFYASETAYICAGCGAWLDSVDVVPREALQELVEELEELRIENTEKKQERDAKGDYEGMANYAGKEFAYFRAVERIDEIIADYTDE